jgi:hypothetical protein
LEVRISEPLSQEDSDPPIAESFPRRVGRGYPQKRKAPTPTAVQRPDAKKMARQVRHQRRIQRNSHLSWTHIDASIFYISSSTWKAYDVNTVPYQSHSSTPVAILSSSSSQNSSAPNSSSLHGSAFHVSTPFLSNSAANPFPNENIPPSILNPNIPNVNRKVLCSRCGVYVDHGMNQTTNYPLVRHQKGQKCKVGFAGAYMSFFPTSESLFQVHFILQILFSRKSMLLDPLPFW